MRGVAPARLVALSIALGSASGVVAQPAPTGVLVYTLQAPEDESCPTERDLRDVVVARLGRDPFVAALPDSAVPRVSVIIVASPDRLHGEMVVRDTSGEAFAPRSIEAARGECQALGAAVGLAIAIVFDPLTTPLTIPPAPPPARTTIPEPHRPSPHDPERPPALRARRPTVARPPADVASRSPRAALRAGATALFGYLPRTSVGGTAGVELRWSRIAALLDVGAATPFAAVPLRGGAIEVATAWIAGALCFDHRRIAWACARSSVGLLDARHDGEPRGNRLLVADGGLRAGIGWPIARTLALRLDVDAAIPFVQPTIRIGGEAAWTGPSLLFSAGAGATLVL